MKNIIKWFFKTFFYWTVIFAVARLIFALYQWPQTSSYPITVVLKSFYHGIHQDFSASGYLTMLNGIFLFIFTALGLRNHRIPFKILNFILMMVIGVVVSADSELYRNWGVHMDATPLLYLKTPKEAFASATLLQMCFSTIVFAVFVFIAYRLYRFCFNNDTMSVYDKVSRRVEASVLISFLTIFMILPIRGGVGIAPMNSGTVYFSKDLYPNHLAVNASWNFIYSVTKMNRFAAPYTFMDDQEAELVRADVFKKTNLQKIKSSKPNVLLILMESFSGKMVGALGYKEYTPNLTRIASEGVLFNHIYSTGDRSDRGIVGVVSGYPSEPTASIMKYPQKSQKLPFITKELKKEGYSTTYYYGGDTNFANMHSFLVSAEFDRVVDETFFDPKDCNSKWGVHDGVMLDYLMRDIQKESVDNTKPFFKMLFTISSSHEPFEVPMETVIEGTSEEAKFLNAVTYTDRCLGKFYDEAKKQPWFKNTLIVFVADHGHRMPYDSKANDPEKYHIPLIMAGGAIKNDTIITKCGSNTDVPATILGRLGLSSENFHFSKDLMDKNSSSFGYFVYSGGVGACVDSSKVVLDLHTNKVSYKEHFEAENLHKIKAVLQSAWNEFLGKRDS